MDQKTKPVILLTGGGSGGHLTPILSLALALKRKAPGCRLVYVGLKGEKIIGLHDQFEVFDSTFRINSGKLRRSHGSSWLRHLLDIKSLVLNLRDAGRVTRGILQARRLIKRVKPDIVFSKGGYVAVPVGIAAKLANVPIITHDSDAVPGLANRLVGRWAVIHATGMPAVNYSYPKATIRYTGTPVASNLRLVTKESQSKAKTEMGIPKSASCLMVGGAGHGSRTLNKLAVSMAPELIGKIPQLHIIHLAGTNHEADVKTAYAGALNAGQFSQVKVYGFSQDFHKFSAAADLVITRAGASSIAEFAAQGKACIVIPSPWLAGGHQLKNAAALQQADAAAVVDNGISAGELQKLVLALLNDESERQQLAANLHRLAKPDAADELAAVILGQVSS